VARQPRKRSIESINAEINALKSELQQREQEEAMRIAAIVQASGLAALGLPDNELRLALDQFVKSFRKPNSGADLKPERRMEKAAKADTDPATATISSRDTSPHESR